MATENHNIHDIVDKMSALKTELAKVIVGQQDVIDQIIITLLAGGHALLTGVPGLGKTLLVKSVAQLFSLSFKRIQFTPDLMPADIFGTEVLQEDPATGSRAFKFIQGPVFANIVLADEINRTPPKTQAALLEAMGEYHVTSAGKTIDLERPFFVLATQNPIELEGTYPLPEAQLDRFLLNIVLDYLPVEDEVKMVRETRPNRRRCRQFSTATTSSPSRNSSAKCLFPTMSSPTPSVSPPPRGRTRRTPRHASTNWSNGAQAPVHRRP